MPLEPPLVLCNPPSPLLTLTRPTLALLRSSYNSYTHIGYNLFKTFEFSVNFMYLNKASSSHVKSYNRIIIFLPPTCMCLEFTLFK